MTEKHFNENRLFATTHEGEVIAQLIKGDRIRVVRNEKGLVTRVIGDEHAVEML